MKFNVKRTEAYTLDKASIKAFKERMIECFEEKYLEDGQECHYTIDDISDDIIKEPLAELIQEAFQYYGQFNSGVIFDDYFNSVGLECSEEDVRDVIYEATEIWITEMEEK